MANKIATRKCAWHFQENRIKHLSAFGGKVVPGEKHENTCRKKLSGPSRCRMSWMSQQGCLPSGLGYRTPWFANANRSVAGQYNGVSLPHHYRYFGWGDDRQLYNECRISDTVAGDRRSNRIYSWRHIGQADNATYSKALR